jgi:PBP superfamily domain
MDDAQLKEYRAKRGMAILHFPTVLGADVPIYNIPGVAGELKFTPEALAGIFLGKITKWDDPRLTKTNLEAKLPKHDMVVAFRSDGSGTTYIWTDYLAKVSEEWNSDIGFGTSVPWPVGLAGRGNGGVAAIVKQTHIRLDTLSFSWTTRPIKAVAANPGRSVSAKTKRYCPGNMANNQRALSGPRIAPSVSIARSKPKARP